MGCARLDPGPDAVESRAYHHHIPHAPGVEQPHDGQDEGNVGEKVDHGEPVNSHGADVVEAHEDVADDAVLQPHEGIAHGVGTEDEEHDPPPLVQPGLHQWDELHSVQN